MLLCVAALVLGFPPADSTRPRPITQLVHTTWSAEDGAPSEITSLAQTADGYLWIGSWTGLYRFDGVRFVKFSPHAGDHAPSTAPGRLFASRDTSLWIVWGLGSLTRLKNGRMTSWGPENGFPRFNGVGESGDGTLIAGTSTGLMRFDGTTWHDVTREFGFPGHEATSVWFDRSGGLWAVSEDHIVSMRRGSRRFQVPGMPLRSPDQTPNFAEEQDGTVWVSELARSVHTVPRRAGTAVSEVSVGASAVVVARDGSLWIATFGDGLRRVLEPSRYRGRVIGEFGREAEQYTERNGLMSDVVNAMLQDREGNIWIGTGRGIERFEQGAFTPYPTAGSVRPRIIFAGRDTTLWIAVQNTNDFVRMRPHSQDTIRTSDVFPLNLAQDRHGTMWTGWGSALLRRRGGRRFVPFPLAGREVKSLTSLAVDTAGTLWAFDADRGLLRLDHDSLDLVVPHDTGAFRWGTLLADRDGRIWVGMFQGDVVTLYAPGRPPRVFDGVHGTAPQGLRGFVQDRDDSVWCFGEEGLSRFDGHRFRTLRARQGIPGRAVYSAAEDDDGAWWLATQSGVVRVPPDELDRALADSSYVVRSRIFGPLDGVPGMVQRSMLGPVVARTTDGKIWVATDRGVARVDPRDVPALPPPEPLIESLRYGGKEFLPSDTIVVPPGTNDLEIDYTAAELSRPNLAQFRYRLDGEDGDWRDVGTRRRAYYTVLAPGRYSFHVAASDGDAEWRAAATTLHFRVLPAWYQTLSFRAAVVLLIAGLGGLLVALTQRRRHAQAQASLKERYEAAIAERTRIAQDLHDTLLQGFFGVLLQLKAAELALPEQPDVAAETLLRVQNLAQASLRETRERVWDMREVGRDGDDLPSALEIFASERTAGTGIEVRMTAAGIRRRLSEAIHDAAFRTGRESVVNAVRHSGCRVIEIHCAYGKTSLRLEVRDDGRGFTPDEAEAARRKGHFGVSGARERAVRMGGHFEIVPREGGGTLVRLELPIEG